MWVFQYFSCCLWPDFNVKVTEGLLCVIESQKIRAFLLHMTSCAVANSNVALIHSHFYFWVLPIRCSGTSLKPVSDCHRSCLLQPTPSFCQCCKIWSQNFSSISCTKGRPTMLCVELLLQQNSHVSTSLLPGRFSQLARLLVTWAIQRIQLIASFCSELF